MMDLDDLQKDEFIRLIEYSLKKRVFSARDACEQTGIPLEHFRFIRHSIYELSAPQAAVDFDEDNEQDWYVSAQAFFHFVQFIEYKHAVASAKRSTKIAILAVIIAIVTALLSLATTIFTSRLIGTACTIKVSQVDVGTSPYLAADICPSAYTKEDSRVRTV
jgi:hypothetical protein